MHPTYIRLSTLLCATLLREKQLYGDAAAASPNGAPLTRTPLPPYPYVDKLKPPPVKRGWLGLGGAVRIPCSIPPVAICSFRFCS